MHNANAHKPPRRLASLQMLQAVGRKADGWIGFLGQPEYIGERVLPLIAQGAAKAGRDVSEIEKVLLPICVVHPDREAIR